MTIKTVTKTNRYYVVVGSSSEAPTIDLSWDHVAAGGLETALNNTLTTTKPTATSTLARSADSFTSPTPHNLLLFQGSVAVPEDTTYKGKARAVFPFLGSFSADHYMRMVVRMYHADGSSTHLLTVVDDLELTAGSGIKDQRSTRTVEGDLTEVISQSGDRLVVEIGVVVTHPGSVGNRYAYLWYGGPEVATGQDIVFQDDIVGSDDLSWIEIESVQIIPTPRISWSPVNPHYHHGVDQGVLYPLDGPGVAWNGLVSVEDAHVGGEFEPVYMDGIKRLNLPSGRNYQATLSAYSTPEEFGPCNGEINVMKGLILTRQPRQHFGFSYRTMVGDSGYQIHLVYNALATPTGRSYTTKTDAPSPSIPTWTIDALPISSKAPRPTAHYILDSTEIGEDQMAVIESLLYGADDRNAYLPSIGQIAAIATNWDPQVIEPNNISGLHSLSDGMGDVQETDVYGVYISIPTGRLTETEVKGLFQLTE